MLAVPGWPDKARVPKDPTVVRALNSTARGVLVAGRRPGARPGAPRGAPDEERQNGGMIEFLKSQIMEKDHQINSLLERDQETNVLIRGLQEMMFRLQPPKDTPPLETGDNSTPHAVEDQVEYRDGAG